MPQQSRSTIKNWLRKGLKPLQDQFWDWLDSFWHKDDQIPTTSVSGLDTTLTGLNDRLTNVEANGGGGGGGSSSSLSFTDLSISNSGTFSVNANDFIDSIVILPGTGTYSIGTTSGGNQLASGDLDSSNSITIDLRLFYQAGATIHFTGTFTVKILSLNTQQSNDVNDLAVSNSATYAVSSNQLLDAVILLPGTGTYSIGTTSGGSQLATGNLDSGNPITVDLRLFYQSAATIHFTGTFTAKIFTQ